MTGLLALMFSGLVSYFLVSNGYSSSELIIPDLSGDTTSINGALNVTLCSSPMSIGTSVITIAWNDHWLPSGIFTMAIGTVVADRRSEQQPLKLKERILIAIEDNPGVHLRELQRTVECAMGALQYHIRNLEKSGIIEAIKVGNSKHFFLSGFSDDEKVLVLSAVGRNPTVQSILSEVLSKNRVTQAELSRTLSLDKSLISYYTSTLLKADILRTIKVFGRERPIMLNEWAHSAILEMAIV